LPAGGPGRIGRRVSPSTAPAGLISNDELRHGFSSPIVLNSVFSTLCSDTTTVQPAWWTRSRDAHTSRISRYPVTRLQTPCGTWLVHMAPDLWSCRLDISSRYGHDLANRTFAGGPARIGRRVSASTAPPGLIWKHAKKRRGRTKRAPKWR